MTHPNTWSAVLDAGKLTVSGQYTFATTGYSVHLTKKEPQPKNHKVLQLEKVVTPPKGIVADHVVTIPVKFEEHTTTHYEEVEILPDDTKIKVTHAA